MGCGMIAPETTTDFDAAHVETKEVFSMVIAAAVFFATLYVGNLHAFPSLFLRTCAVQL